MDILHLHQLLAELMKINPPETPVILSRDSEGNNFSPLSSWSEGIYVPESSYSGNLLDEGKESEDGCKAVVLWPVN